MTAGILTWQCQGSVCTISGPWPAPAAQACAQLAREVGRIVAYGREGNMLGAPGLATCNSGIAAVAPTLRLPPRVITGGPLITVRPQPQAQPGQPAQPQPEPTPTPAPSASGSVTTPELSFIVGGSASVSAETTRVDVPPMSFVVGDPVPLAPPADATTVAVPELSFIVQ